MSLIRKHGAVLQAWACLALVSDSFTLNRWIKTPPVCHPHPTAFIKTHRIYTNLKTQSW